MISADTLIDLSLGLAKSINSVDRFDQMLSHVRKVIPCDAIALLQFYGDYLSPIAMQGLSKESLGRRFILEQNPRLQQIVTSRKAVRFPPDCPLPDPYDGLLIAREGALPVHSCMGLPLYFENKLVGALTLDSLEPAEFEAISEKTLELIASLAATNLYTALTLDVLEHSVNHSKQVLEAVVGQGGQQRHEIIGLSPEIKTLKKEIALVAPSDFPVLISGESGSGKELIAQNIHGLSHRSQEPMVYINCAALPENLIESELFGHTKGAFTGADKERAGKFQVADGGTLFLDEIGELPLAAQSKLLRVLQSGEVQALGQDQIVHVDVRVIAATNRDLQNEIRANKFRADLYHRLNVYPVHAPPLRKRLQDAPLIAGYFIELIKRKLGIGQVKLSAGVENYIRHYEWPGNVRELEHFISRSSLKAKARAKNSAMVVVDLIDCDLAAVDSSSLRFEEGSNSTFISGMGAATSAIDLSTESLGLRGAIDEFQRGLILRALEQERGSWSRAAKRLKVDRANLSRLAKRLGISIEKRLACTRPSK
ncbi:nitric oxide reductase transcriptional regulator NorR [Agaribacterium sp. ZY112]|uniref:nitric oxide reductase transcriptional regulator NorR n=1 Tax=Agaribacterium sp. ZY112 TaxID=3233574 RepID=UPI003524C8EC